MNGGHEGGEQGKRGERGDRGGEGGGERGGGGKNGNKGGGKKDIVDHGANVDASGMSMGMGGAHGYAYVGPQVCMPLFRLQFLMADRRVLPERSSMQRACLRRTRCRMALYSFYHLCLS